MVCCRNESRVQVDDGGSDGERSSWNGGVSKGEQENNEFEEC